METYAEYAGLTAEAVRLIEEHRKDPAETKSQILVRALGSPAPESHPEAFDYGEGIKIFEGEQLFLFLPGTPMRADHATAHAVVRKDGFYLEGKNIGPAEKRQFTPAMKMVQQKLKDFNEKGELKSLSAIRQWHVLRDGKLQSLESIKNPELARKRKRLSDLF